MQDEAATHVKTVPTPASKPWYSHDEYEEDGCSSVRSPAYFIGLIRDADEVAEIQDYGDPSAPSRVDVTEVEADGRRNVQTFWRLLDECTSDLKKHGPIPLKYQ
jgi:hypothetical protein